MVPESCRWLLKILIELNEAIYQLWNLSLMKAKSGETLNIKVVENSISFLKRVEIHNFDTGRRDHKGSKLMEFSRYDFELESIFLSFFWFSGFTFLCNMNV
jgi:hypothetical protein